MRMCQPPPRPRPIPRSRPRPIRTHIAVTRLPLPSHVTPAQPHMLAGPPHLRDARAQWAAHTGHEHAAHGKTRIGARARACGIRICVAWASHMREMKMRMRAPPHPLAFAHAPPPVAAYRSISAARSSCAATPRPPHASAAAAAAASSRSGGGSGARAHPLRACVASESETIPAAQTSVCSFSAPSCEILQTRLHCAHTQLRARHTVQSFSAIVIVMAGGGEIDRCGHGRPAACDRKYQVPNTKYTCDAGQSIDSGVRRGCRTHSANRIVVSQRRSPLTHEANVVRGAPARRVPGGRGRLWYMRCGYARARGRIGGPTRAHRLAYESASVGLGTQQRFSTPL